jgi:non-ribosomal peptide synthetase component F
VSANDGLRVFRKEANTMLSREARLEDMEVVARLLAEVAALRAKAAAADRVRELADELNATAARIHEGQADNSEQVVADSFAHAARRIRRALDGPPC